MAEELIITATDKAGIYAEILPQIEAVVSAETDMVANMANVSAILREAFGFWWVGFYIVKPSLSGGEELVLGPFQGPLACTRIKKGRGVCGAAWEQAQTVIVPDVEQFPGHIACSSLSRSEIVVPVFASDGSVMAVLDIDSEHLSTFDVVDKEWLEKMLLQINFGNK